MGIREKLRGCKMYISAQKYLFKSMKIFYGRLAVPRFSERVELDAAMR